MLHMLNSAAVCALQCALVMKMHMLNPLTTREFSASKLEDPPDAPGDADASERWLTLAVRPLPCHPCLTICSLALCTPTLCTAP